MALNFQTVTVKDADTQEIRYLGVLNSGTDATNYHVNYGLEGLPSTVVNINFSGSTSELMAAQGAGSQLIIHEVALDFGDIQTSATLKAGTDAFASSSTSVTGYVFAPNRAPILAANTALNVELGSATQTNGHVCYTVI